MRTPLIVVVALVRGLVVAVTLSVAAPARAEEMATFQTLRWRSPLGALLESQGNSAIAGERVTVDEAIALALNANRPAKNAARLQLVTESVIQAYAAVQRAQRALEIREEALRMSRELDRLMVELADRGEAAPAIVLQARAGLERATIAVLWAREDVGTWSGQLNHLIGRDPQARLVVTREPGPTPILANRVGVTATDK
jgi:outer membrane protein TolC